MDALLIFLGILLLLAGIIGSFVPVLPGPPLAFLALLLQQFKAEAPYSLKFLLIWAGITIGVSVIDYVIPAYGTRVMGGSKYGIWGCFIGLFIGIWWAPFGLIAGPFLGAFIAELWYNNNSNKALKAAFGSFIGFVAGSLLKLICCVMMCYYFITVL
ncbi:MAG TPA: DUF456 domain-containing protein [Cyclobacteriaceae bacterium]|nr:DUF456 domain-containing protein [Cyclobacteriaceae bacterium]